MQLLDHCLHPAACCNDSEAVTCARLASYLAVCLSVGNAEDINRGRLELPERVLRELQAEAAVMSHMRHPK